MLVIPVLGRETAQIPGAHWSYILVDLTRSGQLNTRFNTKPEEWHLRKFPSLYMREYAVFTHSYKHLHTHKYMHVHSNMHSNVHTQFSFFHSTWVCGKVDVRNHPLLLLYLIHWGRISHSNPKLTNMCHPASQPTQRLPCLHLLRLEIHGCSPGIFLSS